MPEEPFTKEQVANLLKLADAAPQLLGVLENYNRAGWLGRVMWKLVVAMGTAVAGVAAFKEHLSSIFKTGG